MAGRSHFCMPLTQLTLLITCITSPYNTQTIDPIHLNAIMDHQEEDLYGDLSDTKPAAALNPTTHPIQPQKPSASSSSSKHHHQQQQHPGSLSTQVEVLQKQVERLQKENDTLRRNMGTLYRTAKSEIQRKDTEIESLVKQLDHR